MRKIYSYVGSLENLRLVAFGSRRLRVDRAVAIANWSRQTGQTLEFRMLTVTFIVDERGQLWINDRRSEHVVCADGGKVLTAGELSFFLAGGQVEFHEASNQSTGYCPEPDSWPALAAELTRLGFLVPDGFTPAFQFRFCRNCQEVNIVRDDWFVCALCDETLDRVWNFAGVGPR